jgi:hypothetical protein
MKLRLLLLIVVLASCKKPEEDLTIIVGATPILSKTSIAYGLVENSFAHILDEPSPQGASRALLRKGDIVRVVERRLVSTTQPVQSGGGSSGSAASARGAQSTAGTPVGKIWMRIETLSPPVSGWLADDALLLYPSLLKAENARTSILGLSTK